MDSRPILLIKYHFSAFENEYDIAIKMIMFQNV